jgi:hypothetical protein
MASRFRRDRRGRFHVRLAPEERDLLRSLPAKVREALDEIDASGGDGDPAAARLFPPAYTSDPDREAEYRGLMRGDLADGRRAALDAFEAGIDAEILEQDELLAWLRALNDIRLLLGSRLDVTEEQSTVRVSPGDPRAAALSLYQYLSWLEEDLVEALS